MNDTEVKGTDVCLKTIFCQVKKSTRGVNNAKGLGSGRTKKNLSRKIIIDNSRIILHGLSRSVSFSSSLIFSQEKSTSTILSPSYFY